MLCEAFIIQFKSFQNKQRYFLILFLFKINWNNSQSCTIFSKNQYYSTSLIDFSSTIQFKSTSISLIVLLFFISMQFYQQNTDYPQTKLTYQLGNRAGMMLETLISYYRLPILVTIQTGNSSQPIELDLPSAIEHQEQKILQYVLQMIDSLHQIQQNSLDLTLSSLSSQKDNLQKIVHLKSNKLDNLINDLQLWNHTLFDKLEILQKNFFGHQMVDNETLAITQTVVKNQLKAIQRNLKSEKTENIPFEQIFHIILANKLYYCFLYYFSQEFWEDFPLLKSLISQLIQDQSFTNVYGASFSKII